MRHMYLQHAGSQGNPAGSLPVSISVDGLAKGMLRPGVQGQMWDNATATHANQWTLGILGSGAPWQLGSPRPM